ncbi:MAG: WYL domain-containing protein [Muribaculaceae bacterium]|nr:WYL domain-containing protein [Muribaculaceae bacterium]
MGNLSILTRRYIWLIETIQRAGKISLKDINLKWNKDAYLFDEPASDIPKRTFHRHKMDIFNLFGIEIKCDRCDNTYFIDYENSDVKTTFTKKILYSLNLDLSLRNNIEKLAHIIFENTPGGMEFLSSFIHALIYQNILDIQYCDYNSTDIKNYKFHTYGLKQSTQRWYAIGFTEGKSETIILALDRILDIQKNNDCFKRNKKVNIRKLFDEIVGINLDDEFDCEEVIIRIYGRQRAYLESLPLHKSQKIIFCGKDYSDYSLKLRPEYEFHRAILGMGEDAEVISPVWVRNNMKRITTEMLARYS